MLSKPSSESERVIARTMTHCLQSCDTITDIVWSFNRKIHKGSRVFCFDAVVTFWYKHVQKTIVLECFPSALLRRNFAETFTNKMHQVAYYQLLFPDYLFVLATDRFTESQMHHCHEIGVGTIDLGGNCLLQFDDVFIKIVGQKNTYLNRKEVSLDSEKSKLVLDAMNSKPDHFWKSQELSEAAGVSMGSVSYVRQALRREEQLEETKQGFRIMPTTQCESEKGGDACS